MKAPTTADGKPITIGTMVFWADGDFVRVGYVSSEIPPDEHGVNVDDGTEAEWLFAPGDLYASNDALKASKTK